MLKKDELKVLRLLFDDLTRDITISDISRLLKQKYPQTHRIISGLEAEKLIKIKKVGNNKVIKLDFTKQCTEYTITEIIRCKLKCENKTISIIQNNIQQLNKNIVCILFGSYASNSYKKTSDIDLLFVMPEEYDYSAFEKVIKKQLAPYNCDINITTEQGLLEMWSRPERLSVGNEVLRKHIILCGAEHFINLLRQYHVG